MKMTYTKPEFDIIDIAIDNAIMSASMGGDTGYLPGGLIPGGELTDED